MQVHDFTVISAKLNFISFGLSFQLVKMILNLDSILHFINDFLCHSVHSINCIDRSKLHPFHFPSATNQGAVYNRPVQNLESTEGNYSTG